MAKEAVNSLVDCLQNQADRYRALLELAKVQTDAIVRHDLEVLKEVNGRQHHMVMELGRLEMTRTEAVKVLSSHFSIPPEEATVSRLVELLGPEEGSGLQAAGEELSRITRELARINQENRELLEMSLEFVDFSLSMLTGAGARETRYDERGRDMDHPAKAPSKVLDLKA